jgi:hypothetical protein
LTVLPVRRVEVVQLAAVRWRTGAHAFVHCFALTRLGVSCVC